MYCVLKVDLSCQTVLYYDKRMRKRCAGYLRGEDNMHGKLLEELAQRGNTYISDLKYAAEPLDILLLLQEVNCRAYSLEECNYSLSYIFDQELLFHSYKEVERFLEKYII